MSRARSFALLMLAPYAKYHTPRLAATLAAAGDIWFGKLLPSACGCPTVATYGASTSTGEPASALEASALPTGTRYLIRKGSSKLDRLISATCSARNVTGLHSVVSACRKVPLRVTAQCYRSGLGEKCQTNEQSTCLDGGLRCRAVRPLTNRQVRRERIG